MILILKNRLGIHDEQTALDELRWIQERTEEKENSVQPENLMRFIDNHPIFNSCRMLIVNPNGMNEEIFLRIFLRRLVEGNLALVIMEIPENPGDAPKELLNHVSFIHSEKGEVYFDGLQVDLNFILRALYFSRPTTLILVNSNRGIDYEKQDQRLASGLLLVLLRGRPALFKYDQDD